MRAVALLAPALLVSAVPGLTVDLSLGAVDVNTNVSLGVPGSKSAVCAAIEAALPSKVFYALSTQYVDSSKYYSAQESQLQPNCYVNPTSAQDVSTAVKILAAAYKNDTTNRFAVRSGGHTSWPGAANIDKGVTIDLSSLNGIVVAPNNKTTLIQPGATWGDVYEKLDKMSLGVAGGRVSSVGVGGLTIGGGISFLSPRVGFVCDNILDFEIVLGDGRILHANAQQNADLWKALKGGSSNFGIVTAYTAITFPLGQLWGGIVTYDVSTVPRQLTELYKFNNANYDEYASLIQTHTFVNPLGVPLSLVVNSMAYSLPQPYPASLKPFSDIPSVANTLRVAELKSFGDELGSQSGAGKRQFEMSLTYVHDAALLNKTYALFDATKDKVKNVQGLTWLLIFEPIPTQITSKSAPRGGNVLGLSSTSKPLMLVLLQAIWDQVSDDQTVIPTMKTLFNDINAAAAQARKAHPFQYLNYADISLDPIGSYGAANKAFLQSVAKKYDPRGVFQKAIPGGFKLFK